MDKKIFVTQPDLPSLEEFNKSLGQIWRSKWITNDGSFHQELEKQLADFLSVPYVSLFTNGTIALIAAFKALDIEGEVITTPFSFVATTHALYWNGLTPVFVDIDPGTCNIDPEKIEAAITPRTTAILPVHVYGNPCDVEKIQQIAHKHNLKVIYDSAHAFGVEKERNSILNFGDLSVLSFHATKTFNTIEGGAIISHEKETKNKIDYLKNFGFDDETVVIMPGINGKMNELQAAYGLLQLKAYRKNLIRREKLTNLYYKLLQKVDGIRLLERFNSISYNYSYLPIFVTEECSFSREDLYHKLRDDGIFTRRYFYPLISEFSPYNQYHSSDPINLRSAVIIANQVLCLPLYSNLSPGEVNHIVSVIRSLA